MIPKNELHASALEMNPQKDGAVGDFVMSVHDAFLAAENRTGQASEFHYSVAGLPVKVRFAGDGLAPLLTPALQHLEINAPEDVSLTIGIFDRTTTGLSIPQLPWSAAGHRGPGAVEYCRHGQFHIAFQRDIGVVSIGDLSSRRAFFWAGNPESLPSYERCSPLRKIMHWWMLQHGVQMIHAAAVGTAEGGVLIAGKGGSGKSSSALACLDSSLRYLSDDYCLLRDDPVPHVFSMYNSVKIEEDNLFRFPRLKPLFSGASRADAEKPYLFLYQHCPEKLVRNFPVLALLVPRISAGRDTTLTPVSPARGLTALAPSTLFQFPGAGEDSFRIMAGFTRKTPSYLLELGADVSRLPHIITELLSGEKQNVA